MFKIGKNFLPVFGEYQTVKIFFPEENYVIVVLIDLDKFLDQVKSISPQARVL
jgi:hypothetical protein